MEFISLDAAAVCIEINRRTFIENLRIDQMQADEYLTKMRVLKSTYISLDLLANQPPDRFITCITLSKTEYYSTVPPSPAAVDAAYGFVKERYAGAVTQSSSDGNWPVLSRWNVLPAHVWRWGWAVNAICNGVSEVSVRTKLLAGLVQLWSSGTRLRHQMSWLRMNLNDCAAEREIILSVVPVEDLGSRIKARP